MGPSRPASLAADVPGYRVRIDVDGEVTIDAVVDAFNLPFGELLAGQTRWQGQLLIARGGRRAELAAPRSRSRSNLVRRCAAFPAAVREAAR